MNDIMRPDGLKHLILAFSFIPRFPMIDWAVPNQKYHMNAVEKARNEIANMTAEIRLQKVLAARVPRNAEL